MRYIGPRTAHYDLTGHTALAMFVTVVAHGHTWVEFRVQLDDPDHLFSHGWWKQNYEDWVFITR